MQKDGISIKLAITQHRKWCQKHGLRFHLDLEHQLAGSIAR